MRHRRCDAPTSISTKSSSLRALSERRGQPVATLVREAIDVWLSAQGVRRIPDDEWQRRFFALLERRTRNAEERGFSQEEVERYVIEALREVRKARTARRRREIARPQRRRIRPGASTCPNRRAGRRR